MSINQQNLISQSRIPVEGFVQEFRLTLASVTPVTSTDVTGATTIYCSPYQGNRIALYTGTTWVVRQSSEFSLALGTLVSGKPYDVFCYDNSGVPTLEFLVWTNDTTRATALVYNDGVLSKTGDLTRRYLGTFYTTSTTTTEDSSGKRFLWNYYNRISKTMKRFDPTASWTYSTAVLRQANGSTANQLEFIVGVPEVIVQSKVSIASANATGAVGMCVGIGLDSTSTHTDCISLSSTNGTASGLAQINQAYLDIMPTAGRHYLTWLEWSTATGTSTWNNIFTNPARQSGMTGSIPV